MAVKLDASNYLVDSTNPFWGVNGTLFFRLFHTWATSDGVDHHMFFKSLATYVDKGFYFDKYTNGAAYIGWYYGGDMRIVIDPAIAPTAFPASVWNNHLFDWDYTAELQRYFSNNAFIGQRVGAFYVEPDLPQLAIGCRLSGGATSGAADALYAELGRWNRVLTAQERAVLQATGCPLMIPNGLRAYYRCLNAADAVRDLSGNDNGVVVGAPLSGTHPRVFYPATSPQISLEFVAPLLPPVISSPITLFAPMISMAGQIAPPLLSSPVTLFAPTIEAFEPVPAVGVSTYPPDIDLASNLIIAGNNIRSSLVGALAIDGMSITVANASGWPASGALTFDVAVADRTPTSSEIVYYSGRDGNVLTLSQRAVGGTTAKAWIAGSSVEGRHIAEHHNLHSSAIIALQTEVETKADTAHTHPMLPLSGGTLTGPLTLAGPPTASLHATTKAYVDGVAGGLLPNTYLVTDFNAAGVMATTTGSIAASSNQLTVASATGFAVGQGIYVAGAGPASPALITSISAIAGNVFTLATTASASVSGALVQHDDTAAIQTAINTVISAGGGELLFPGGYYRCNGPLQASNSVLRLPYISPSTTPPVAIKLTGLAPISWFSWETAVPQANNGVIIQSDVQGVNANSSLFAAALWDATTTSTAPFTHIMIYIDQIRFRTYANPNLSGLDLGMAGGAALGFVSVETGGFWEGEPTHVDCFGLRMPRVNTVMAMSCCDMAYVHNYYIGCILSEMPITKDAHFFAMRCKVGFKCLFSYYPIAAELLAWQCPTGVIIDDYTYFDVNLYVEQSTSGWNVPIYQRDIYDPSNRLHGVVRYSVHNSGAGTGSPISVTGATAVVFTNLRA